MEINSADTNAVDVAENIEMLLLYREVRIFYSLASPIALPIMELGGHRELEGAEPGQLIQTGHRYIPYHMAYGR